MATKDPTMCAECDRLAIWLAEAIQAYAAAVKRLEQTPEGAAFERAREEAGEARRLCEECRAVIIQHDREHSSLRSAQERQAAQTGENFNGRLVAHKAGPQKLD
jgi:hypothetical protein